MSPGGPPKFPTNEAPKHNPKVESKESAPRVDIPTSVEKVADAPIKIEEGAEALSPRLSEAKDLLAKIAEDMPYNGDPTPWKVEQTGSFQKVEWLIDEMEMGIAVNDMPEGEAKDRCNANLSKIYRLFEQEKKDVEEKYKSNMPECGPLIEGVEATLAAFETKYNLEQLSSVTTATTEEILRDETRKAAIKDLETILYQLRVLNNITNVTTEQMNGLYAKYGKLSSAVGIHNNGNIDHTLKQISKK